MLSSPAHPRTAVHTKCIRSQETSVPKFVYQFAEGHKDLKDLLGGKGAKLAEMTRMGLPVPPGFTITTEACTMYLTNGQEPCELRTQVDDHLGALEATMNKKLGQSDDPLLVSVRSGARFSMRGMMETVLNIGLNDESVRGLALQSGNERFAFDSYRRLIQMFGKTALGVGGDHFENALDAAKQAKGAKTDLDLDAADLHKLIEVYKQVVITGWKPKAASPAQCTSNPVPRITPRHRGSTRSTRSGCAPQAARPQLRRLIHLRPHEQRSSLSLPAPCSPAGHQQPARLLEHVPRVSGLAMNRAIGIGKGTVSLEDITDHAELVLVVGHNPGTHHPRMLSALDTEFGIASSREHGLDAVNAIRAMRGGRRRRLRRHGRQLRQRHPRHRRHPPGAARHRADRARVDQAEPLPLGPRPTGTDPAVPGTQRPRHPSRWCSDGHRRGLDGRRTRQPRTCKARVD